MTPSTRRKLLYLVTLAAVVALVLPTGALSSAKVDRSIIGQVADDEDGYIGIKNPSPLELRYGRNGGGVKEGSRVAYSEVTLFELRNQIPGNPTISDLRISVHPADTAGPPPFVLQHSLEYPDRIDDTSWHAVNGSVVCGANDDSTTAITFDIHVTADSVSITLTRSVYVVCVGPPPTTTDTEPGSENESVTPTTTVYTTATPTTTVTTTTEQSS